MEREEPLKKRPYAAKEDRFRVKVVAKGGVAKALVASLSRENSTSLAWQGCQRALTERGESGGLSANGRLGTEEHSVEKDPIDLLSKDDWLGPLATHCTCQRLTIHRPCCPYAHDYYTP